MAQLSESIIKVLAYFDVFNYPITQEEIHHFLDRPAYNQELEQEIQSLLDKQIIWQIGNFYSLRNDKFLVERRLTGNKLAEKQIPSAMKVARLISWYPFVRGVGISGSLSKNFAYEGSDLDFFVIMAANRLWIGRLFLLFTTKFFFMIGLKRLCCLNYYIDEEGVEIEEKNIFTATEVSTLLPAKGKQTFQRFFTANQWKDQYLPNNGHRKIPAKDIAMGPVKRFLEWLMDNRLGNSIDNWLLKYFRRHWEKQLPQNHLNPRGVPLGAVKSGKHYCKPDSHYFQQRILNKVQDKVAEIKNKFPAAIQPKSTASGAR